MTLTGRATLLTLLVAALVEGALAQDRSSDPLADGFRDVPADARPRLYWRVFGPAWIEEEIEAQLQSMLDAGLGGAVAYFLYPVALDDPATGVRNQRFLSPEFLRTFAGAARTAQRLGLRFGVNGGTGWPYGGPAVALVDSAQRIRREILDPEPDGGFSLPELREGERVLRAEIAGQDVTDSLSESPRGPGPLVLFITGPTFMAVKRPALGGEGLVLDHYNRPALERYLATVVAPLLEAAPGLVESIGCDSLEVYDSNWTFDLPDEFRARRGYDLVPQLARLFDEQDPLSADLRFDFWRTLAELCEEEFARPLGEWARARGVRLEMEAYGTPPCPLTAARWIDVPTGEHYEWKGFSVSRLAASGAHLAGKRLAGAEAWTWAGIPNRLADSLGDLKLLSDFHFLAGVNELTGVDFPYSPRAAGSPGWLPYYGPCLGPGNPQWPYFRALADYLGRCQWLLRHGTPVADVALYLPVEDTFARGPVDQMLLDFRLKDHFVTGQPTSEFGLENALVHHSNVVHGLLSHGFDFDGLDFWTLDRLARVEEGRLVAGDGSYSVLVLHDIEGIERAALERIAGFCRAGGTVIATRRLPDRCYGVRGREDSARIRSLVAELFGAEDPVRLGGVAVRSCGQGRAIFAPDDAGSLLEALAEAGVSPDLQVLPEQPDVSFVHRRAVEREIYFAVNGGPAPARFTASFRTRNETASIWDPLRGTIEGARSVESGADRRAVALELPARGSTFVVLDAPRIGGPGTEAPSGPERRVPLDLVWHVTFDGPDAPPPRDTRQLASWTEWGEARFFSGRATYSTELALEAPVPRRCRLVLPRVHEVAEVRVNGERSAVLFTPPFEADVSKLVHPGSNRIEITVANLPLNRFLGLPDADLAPLRGLYGQRFPAPEEKRLVQEPVPSGLIGTVLWLTGD